MGINSGNFGTVDHCGKVTRKYLYLMAGLAVFILLSTYIYKFHYLPGTRSKVAAINRISAPPAQFATPPANAPMTGAAVTPVTLAGVRMALQEGPAAMLPVDTVVRQTPFANTVQGIKESIVSISAVQSGPPVGGNQTTDARPRFAAPFSGHGSENIGSGVILSRNGYIVTNNHVVKNSTTLTVTLFTQLGSRRYAADIVKLDEALDLALLKIHPDEVLKPAPLGDSSTVEIADSVITIGSPFGLDQTVSRGVVSGLRRAVVIDHVTHDQLIQTDAAINQGNSGGAMINRNGEVIGINTAIYTPVGAFSGIGFAIPVNKVKAFMQDAVVVDGRPVGLRPAMAAGHMGQNVAAPQGPPIRANAAVPANHADGRDRMACATCHQIIAGKGQPAVVAFQPAMALPVVAQEAAPSINAGVPAPHRDGREKMDCRICHQVRGTAPNARPLPSPTVPAATTVAQRLTQTYFEGAVLETLDPLLVNRLNAQVSDGAFVATVYADTSAALAGLQAGDIIFKLNARWVLTPEEFMQRVADYKVGDSLRLGVYRGGERLNLYLTLSGQIQQPVVEQGMAGGQAALVATELVWMGAELKPITPELMAKKRELNGKKGIYVNDVDRNSLAEQITLQKGDIIQRINGSPVNSMAGLERAINAADLKQGVLFLLERNGRALYLTGRR
jgi:serine protease Do